MFVSDLATVTLGAVILMLLVRLICMPRLIHMCARSHSYMCRDSFTYVYTGVYDVR